MRASLAAWLLMTTVTFAASLNVEGAITVFQAVGTEANKLKAFCELMDIHEQMDDKPDQDLETLMDKLLDQLGSNFKEAWQIAQDADERSPDGRALNAALERLEEKCPN